jgi:hypothetical protein
MQGNDGKSASIATHNRKNDKNLKNRCTLLTILEHFFSVDLH